MPTIIEATSPEEIRQKRREAEVPNLVEILNKATAMLNGRLNLLKEGGTEEFSLTREGLPYTILEALAARFRDKKWEVAMDSDPQAGGYRLFIQWPE